MNKKIISFIILTFFVGVLFIPSCEAPIKLDNKIGAYVKEGIKNEVLFDSFIELLMKFAHKPSVSAGIVKGDELVWSKGYGFYNIEENKQAQPDTIYLTASISKTVTATALMQLYDQGLFELDEDVNNFLPFSFRNPNHPNEPITFRMLLSHRSSLANDNNKRISLSYLPGDPDVNNFPYPWLKDYLTPNGLAYSTSVWSENVPGEEFAYTNVGFSLVGYLVELISGENFNQYCKNHIFEPLHMFNTSFRLRDVNISNLAIPYEYTKGNYLAHPHYGMMILHSAGSMRTTIEDLSHFLIVHMNGGTWEGIEILKNSTVELMHKDHYSSDGNERYGLGFSVKINKFGKKEIGHSGGWPGVHTIMKYRPEDKTAMIALTNSMTSDLEVTLIESIAIRIIFNSFFLKKI